MQPRIHRSRALLPTKSLLALVAAVVTTCVIFGLSYRSLTARTESAASMNQATALRNQLNRLSLAIEQAQGGQRGFLLTGDVNLLGRLEVAVATVPAQVAALRTMLADPDQLRRLDKLAQLAAARLAVMSETARVALADTAAAIELERAGRGRPLMAELRGVVDRIHAGVEAEVERETAEWRASAAWSSYVIGGGAAVLVLALLLVAMFASRDYRALSAEGWVRRLQLELGARMQSDVRLELLGERVLEVIVPNLDAQIAALYVTDPGGLRRIAGHALPADATATVGRGEGLLGQTLIDERIVHLVEVPPGYLAIGSATGRATPHEVVIVPMAIDGRVHAVLELGFFRALSDADLDALRRLGEAIAGAVRASRDRSRLEELLAQTQRQSEELQAQQEELRATNEELEQQTRSLETSQAELENQQHEVEQINAQLEEQAASLERQRDELARAGAELQRSNEYKSQFLANMSHELRTPLNSSLILAKLLADNRDGNLDAEQVKFANTIYAAGNDLLTLINDILDLSKIEAGMLDVRVEPVAIERLAGELRDTFAPIAAQRQLALEVLLAPDLPDAVVTDHTRLQQILKNLVSNALKFTERGGVTLEVSAHGDRLSFAVQDTGIGIAEGQHDLIFEPFRQGDGGSTRKFGGTGLGLSISRDLARLLGGELSVISAPGRGSTFTLTLPRSIEGRAPAAKPVRHRKVAGTTGTGNGNGHAHPIGIAKPLTTSADLDTLPVPPFPDDRAQLTPSSRSLLIVEDDLAFARVLYDLARELEFLAIVASTGGDGLVLARALAPSAIVLDVGLPDRSGLAVLDALKRDPRTRHIPVHVVSVEDYTRTALEMGATGYALKPVQRDELIKVLEKLEARFTRTMRRVLVVEDDPLLRESTARLLSADDVETVTAGTTKEALELVRTSTFDCMVLDLALPDGSGLELLEEMARGEQYSFPPVIVYTGKSLTRDQIHALERFSNTIIIKGARSPERLLDEVTLFLHQVESELPPERQRILRDVRDREAVFEGRHILVVEDDVRNVFALSAVLEPKGAKLRIARNGREALEQLQANPEVDLVLMDIMMPEMDGLEATRRLRADQRFASLPVIALTAKAMIDDREKCLEAGANDYIAKPLDVDKLLSLARVWIRK